MPARCRRPRTATSREVITHATVPGEHLRPDDNVGNVGLVLERHEDDAFGARHLARQDKASNGDPAVLRHSLAAVIHIAHDAEPREAIAEEGDGMLLQRQAGRQVVLRHVLAERHGGQCNLRLREKLVAHVRGEQGQR